MPLFSRKEQPQKRESDIVSDEICDNCEKKSDLRQCRYLTKRTKYTITLCKDCMEQFADMVNDLRG